MITALDSKSKKGGLPVWFETLRNKTKIPNDVSMFEFDKKVLALCYMLRLESVFPGCHKNAH